MKMSCSAVNTSLSVNRTGSVFRCQRNVMGSTTVWMERTNETVVRNLTGNNFNKQLSDISSIITDCVVLWKIQKFDWLISVLKSVPFLHECHFGSAWMSFWPAMPELLPGETRIHSSRVEPKKTIDSKSIKTFHCLTERWYVAIIACCDVPRPCLLQ